MSRAVPNAVVRAIVPVGYPWLRDSGAGRDTPIQGVKPALQFLLDFLVKFTFGTAVFSSYSLRYRFPVKILSQEYPPPQCQKITLCAGDLLD